MSVIDDLLAQALRDLATREQQAAARLISSYETALNRIQRELRTIDAQIAELIANGDDINEQYIRRQRWWREVEASIQREMIRWSSDAAQRIAAVQSGGVRLAVDGAAEIARLAGSPLRGRVYAQAFERWVSAITPGSPLRDVIDGYGDKISEAVLQRMTEGIGGGKAPRSIVREILADVGGEANEARLMTLARTESMRAYRGASADTMGQLQERGIVTGYVWLAALGPRCCIACMARHGTRYTVPPDDFHPACRCICRPEANPDLVPGGGWKGKTGPAWFAEQPEAIQRKMLVTDERFAAYRDGVSLSDMTMIRHSPIWGNSVAIRPSRDLVNAPRRERHPLNPRVFKGKDGIWGSDELPVMEWEAAEARVVLASEIIASLGASPSILRLSIAKRFEMLSKRPKTGPLLDSLSDLVPGWSYLGREPRGEVWNLLFPGEGHQNLLVFGPDKTGSWNVITAHPLRPSQIKRLEGSSWMGKRGEK